MRNAFVSELEKIAAINEKLVLLTGDLGFTIFENFQKNFPERFFNMGVAESNMTGIVSGLGLSGFMPVVYIIVLMRVIPPLTVVCPADPFAAKILLREILKYPGPVYFRLGKKGDPALYENSQKFTIGKGIILKEGKDIAIIATGNMVFTALSTAKLLEKKDINSTVVDMHTVKPIDKDLIIDLSKKVKLIVTIEEHFITGGLGSAVAEVLAEGEKKVRFKRIGIEDKFIDRIGSQEYLRLISKLDPESIAK